MPRASKRGECVRVLVVSCAVQTFSAFTPERLHLLCVPWFEVIIPGGGTKAWQGRAINAVGEGGSVLLEGAIELCLHI